MQELPLHRLPVSGLVQFVGEVPRGHFDPVAGFGGLGRALAFGDDRLTEHASMIPEVGAPARHLRATPYAPANPRAQGDILSPHATGPQGSLQGWGSTWCIKFRRAYQSRATTASEAGAMSWASSWL